MPLTFTADNAIARERTIDICENEFTISSNFVTINETSYIYTSDLNISLPHQPLELLLSCENNDYRHLKVAGTLIS